jgi:predicted PurR-regulated permease PerM
MLWVLRPVLAVLAGAAGLAYLLDPFVDAFEDRGFSRESGITAVFGILTGAVGLFLLVLLPGFITEFETLSSQLKPALANLDGQLAPAAAWVSEKTGREIPVDLASLQAEIQPWLAAKLPEIQAQSMAVVTGLLTQGLGLVSAVLSLALLPIFVFYLLRDWDRIIGSIHANLPAAHRGRIVRVAKEADLRIGAFVRGQLTVCVALAALYTAGLLAVGVNLAVPIGLLSGVLFVVPYLGTAVGVVLSVALALIEFGLAWQVGGAIAVFVIAQLIEGWFLTPHVVGDKVGLHPLVVMIALIVGAGLLGIWGMALAIPITAVLSVLGAEWMEAYRSSAFFRQG